MSDPDDPMTGTDSSQPQPQPEPADTFVPFTLEERISQLCEIDKVLLPFYLPLISN